jgi:hypothetical protein
LIVLGPVLRTVTSAVKVTGAVAVAVLFAGLGSVVPLGAVTLTVLLTVLVALFATIPSTMIVILLDAPEFRLIAFRVIAPEPVAFVPIAPVSQSATPEAAQLQDMDAKPAGSASVSVMPFAFDGPLFTSSI